MSYFNSTNGITLHWSTRIRILAKIPSMVLIVTQATITNQPILDITHRMNNLISPFFQMSCIVQSLEK
jgi:hypothetical protein